MVVYIVFVEKDKLKGDVINQYLPYIIAYVEYP